MGKLPTSELSAFLDEIPLESVRKSSHTQLLLPFKDLPDPRKRLKLILDDDVTNSTDGISVEFLPKNTEEWEAIRIVSVRIARRAYQLLQTQRSIGTRCGMENKINIAVLP